MSLKKHIILGALAITLVLAFIVSSSSAALNQASNNSTTSSSTGEEAQLSKIELATPENLKGTADSSTGSITLSWKAVTSATGYNIYRSESANDGTFTKLGSVKDATTYTENGLEANTKYYYQVTAVNSSSAASESPPSNTISVMLGSDKTPTAKSNSSNSTVASSSNTIATTATIKTANNSNKPHVIVFNLEKISVTAASKPNAHVSNATCGQEAGFPIQFDVNGLAPNTTTMWRLVHSNGAKTLGPWGTFATNSTGGFNEPTFIEDLPKGKYLLLFFNSVTRDQSFKPSDAVASALVTVASSNSCAP